jgi:hypothetical protein
VADPSEKSNGSSVSIEVKEFLEDMSNGFSRRTLIDEVNSQCRAIYIGDH